MCGRYTLTPDAERLFEEYGIGVPADYRPRWNVSPGQPILALAGPGSKAGWLHWGLTPHWQAGKRPYVNLRAETLGRTAPRLLERRRCVIPADGFYEWQRRSEGKQPFYIQAEDARLFTMAAVWDRGRGADNAPPTVAILTTEAAGGMREIHGRMPLILDAGERAAWLAADTPSDALRALLASPGVALDAWPVSTRVNDVRNDDPECTRPVI